MADYAKIQNYAAKDTGVLDANRLITGTGIDNELNAISAAISSKANTASPSLVTPNIGVATGTSLALTNGQTIGTSLTVGTTLGVTGDTALTGDLVVNTDKFYVDSVTGATGVLGDLTVNTNKFTVAAASGNTVVAGTLAVTGAITATGGVVGTSSNTSNTNGQIPFPSTQNPSADVNTLDDYEEGTFTTSSTGFTTTLTLNFYYVKVGKLVTLTPGLSNVGTTARIVGTSSDTLNKTLTGVPAHLCPAESAEFSAFIMDDSVNIGQCPARVFSTGVIYFTKQISASGEANGVWTASGITSIKIPTISYVAA